MKQLSIIDILIISILGGLGLAALILVNLWLGVW